MLLEKVHDTVPLEVRDAYRLTRYAVSPCYPGLAEPMTAEEHAQAVTIATSIVAWAETRIETASSQPGE